MKIDVPDELASTAWRLAFWHVKRRCIKEGDTYLISYLPVRVPAGPGIMENFLGSGHAGGTCHDAIGLQPVVQGARPDGGTRHVLQQKGRLNVSGWDLNHGQGHGSMLYAMAQHYLLSGDRAWLAEHLANFKAAAEWIVRERKQWIEKVGPDAWSAGLIPPCELGDYADWRSLYQTNVFFWRGMKHAALAIADVDPAAGARFLNEAEQYRLAIIQAVDRSVVLSPVVRVNDGTYRRYIPPQPYLRGLRWSNHESVWGGPCRRHLAGRRRRRRQPLHWACCPRMTRGWTRRSTCSEDSIYIDNWMVRMHAQQRQPNNPQSWFTMGGYYYQCGYSQSALAHLLRDDVPNYLRSMFNQYAVDVDPEKRYQFREHPNRTGEGNGGDKTFEVGAFLERMRSMLVLEEGNELWLARATPRTWLEQGKKIGVMGAAESFWNGGLRNRLRCGSWQDPRYGRNAVTPSTRTGSAAAASSAGIANSNGRRERPDVDQFRSGEGGDSPIGNVRKRQGGSRLLAQPIIQATHPPRFLGGRTDQNQTRGPVGVDVEGRPPRVERYALVRDPAALAKFAHHRHRLGGPWRKFDAAGLQRGDQQRRCPA